MTYMPALSDFVPLLKSPFVIQSVGYFQSLTGNYYVKNTMSDCSRFYPSIITLLLTSPTVRNLNGSETEMGSGQCSLITSY